MRLALDSLDLAGASGLSVHFVENRFPASLDPILGGVVSVLLAAAVTFIAAAVTATSTEQAANEGSDSGQQGFSWEYSPADVIGIWEDL